MGRWERGDSIRSMVDVAVIMAEAGKLVLADTVRYVAEIPDRVDTWLCKFGEEDD